MRSVCRAATSVVFCILMVCLVRCSSRQLTEPQIEACLSKTDFPNHTASARAAIAWLIAYEQKVQATSCCALEPRVSVMQKRSDLKTLNAELLNRIDTLEAGTDHERRVQLSTNDRCYRKLMDLYHDLMYATRQRR